MANETATTPAESAKRKTVSKRGFLLASGEPAEKMEDAVHGTYQILGTGGKTFTTEQVFTNERAKIMFAIFGFQTKIGNVVNSILNDKDNPGTEADAADSVDAFIDALLTDGTWAERGGGVAQKIDLDKFAEAVFQVGATAGRWTEADTEKKATIRQRADEEEKWRKELMQNPQIASVYKALMGRKVVDLDTAFAGL